MFTEYKVKLLDDHLIIDDGQGIIIDTGSPTSFHESGCLHLCGDTYNLPQSIMNVDSEYLSKEIGGEIHGLLGMDIICKYPILFELRNNFIFVDDDAFYGSSYPSFILPYNMVCVGLTVNNRFIRLIVDTGAKISYIDSSLVEGQNPIECKQDFSPLLGHFSTNIYECEIKHWHDSRIKLSFGTPPPALSVIFATMNVQGVLGIDFFKRFRLQLRDGKLYFPPQGI